MSAPSNKSTNNASVVALCLGMVFGMGGLAYASVPLYKIFCQVTGYGGTTQVAENINGVEVIDREIKVRFDANSASSLNWDFKPVQREVSVKMGEQVLINYSAENLSDKPISGTAIFNITPQELGAYFNKIECFCFTKTLIQPGEKIEMPVTFFIDPEMDLEEEYKGINTITLSYTFSKSDGEDQQLSKVNSDENAGITGEENL